MSQRLVTTHTGFARNVDVTQHYIQAVRQKGKGTKWFIEGDISACFYTIDHTILLDTLRQSFHDNRFILLINGLLKAGYLENWKIGNIEGIAKLLRK